MRSWPTCSLRGALRAAGSPLDAKERDLARRTYGPEISSQDTLDIQIAVEVIQMTMIKTPIEIDQEALETAAEVLGTKTKKDTVNAALKEVGQRLTRLRALAALGEMADRGDFDEFLGDKPAYRR